MRTSYFRKKRLRKKYRQKEFAEYGFECSCTSPFSDRDEIMDTFIYLIESLGFECGGTFNNKKISVFIAKHKGSCTSRDRTDFASRLDSLGYTDISLGELQDCWNL